LTRSKQKSVVRVNSKFRGSIPSSSPGFSSTLEAVIAANRWSCSYSLFERICLRVVSAYSVWRPPDRIRRHDPAPFGAIDCNYLQATRFPLFTETLKLGHPISFVRRNRQSAPLIHMKTISLLLRIAGSLLKRGFCENGKFRSNPSPSLANDSYRLTSSRTTFSVRSPADQLQVVTLTLNEFQSPDPGAIDQ